MRTDGKIFTQWFGSRTLILTYKGGCSFSRPCEYPDFLSIMAGLGYDNLMVEDDDNNIVIENNLIRASKDYITVKIITEDDIVWAAKRLWCVGKNFTHPGFIEEQFQNFMLEAI